MDKRQNQKNGGASFLAGLLTKTIYVVIIIGLSAFVCKSILPTGALSGFFSNTGQTMAEVVPTPSPADTPIPTSTPTSTPIPTATPTPIPTPDFTGQSFIIADNTTGEILLSENPALQILPASTIKLLTAMVALDLSETDKKITISKTVVNSIDPDVTSFHTPVGTTYSLETWLNLLLVHSYGDAANAIAEGTAGSIQQFIVLMNEKISELGLTNTAVDNAIGLDMGNNFYNMYSTAADMLVITREALKYPLILEIISKANYTVPDTPNVPSVEIKNTNPFLSKADLYYSHLFTAVGGKTGSTNAAGNCLTMLVTGMDNREYVCVYYGGQSLDTMATELIRLLEYVILCNQSN